MITITLCMIVKNEERVLARCLDSVADLVDEIVVVDTGSTDATKSIAAKYTDKIYDFIWIGDFAAARNFAFSKATMEYIYSADADEVIDAENRKAFLAMKENLLPEIDIVQMYYANQLSFGTIYNFDKELRPKLFKRRREFTWEGAIHEQVILSPVIYDSDIAITHMPEKNHKDRDIQAFMQLIEKGKTLNKRLHGIFAKELFISGEADDFMRARAFFKNSCMEEQRDNDEIKEAACVVARAARLAEDIPDFFKYAMKVIALEGCSEICMELGEYYLQLKDIDEAIIWFYNGAYETTSILDIRCNGVKAFDGLYRCYHALGMEEQAEEYKQLAEKWCEEQKR